MFKLIKKYSNIVSFENAYITTESHMVIEDIISNIVEVNAAFWKCKNRIVNSLLLYLLYLVSFRVTTYMLGQDTNQHFTFTNV